MIHRSSAVVAMAAAMALHPSASSAVTISEYYIDWQIATDADFTTGVQNVDLSSGAPTVNIPIGDYFQFGVALVLTGNPNPASGDVWDLANQVAGNVPQPVNLGISEVKFDVPSTDTTGYSLNPVLGSIDPSFQPNTGIHDSTARVNPDLAFAFESPGVVSGQEVEDINAVNFVNINPRTPAVAALGNFSGNNAVPTRATPFFTALAFQSQAAGSVKLSPAIEYDPTQGYQLQYWTNVTPGSIATNGSLKSATYSFGTQLTTSDIITPLPVITINVISNQSLLSLSSSSPPATYGSDVQMLTLPPSLGLNVAENFTMPGTKFYFAAPDLDPAAPFVSIYFTVQNNSRLNHTNDLTNLIDDLNSNDQAIVALVPMLPSSDLNLLLEIPQADFSHTNGVAYIGLDLTQVSNVPDISDLSITRILVVPEPGTLGLLLLGGLAFIGRRKRS
jgi:hypothetical protein